MDYLKKTQSRTIIRKEGFNVGIVWYGHLVEEILSLGVPYL
jgi:hypothetical protein